MKLTPRVIIIISFIFRHKTLLLEDEKKIVDQFIVFRLRCNGLERRGHCNNHLATLQKTTHINVDIDNFLTARLTTTLLLSFNIIVKTWPSKDWFLNLGNAYIVW